MDIWDDLQRSGPASVWVNDVELKTGSRVRLHPRTQRDIFEMAVAGRVGVVAGIEQTLEGGVQLAIVLEDDPGRDLGEKRFPGHRFFFLPEEVEPLAGLEPSPSGPRILVAGIGNIFLGDDAFGVAVARQLATEELPAGVEVVDFGIRGLDLAYAMQDRYDAVILVDAAARGDAPGTIYVIEPQLDDGAGVTLETHGMDPVRVLRLAQSLGGRLPRTIVVGCEPMRVPDPETDPDVGLALSAPVRGAIDEACRVVRSLVEQLLAGDGVATEVRTDR